MLISGFSKLIKISEFRKEMTRHSLKKIKPALQYNRLVTKLRLATVGEPDRTINRIAHFDVTQCGACAAFFGASPPAPVLKNEKSTSQTHENPAPEHLTHVMACNRFFKKPAKKYLKSQTLYCEYTKIIIINKFKNFNIKLNN